MKKIKKSSPNKTRLRNQADKIFSEYWRNKIGSCEKCRKSITLQLAHIVTRGCIRLRYERRNTPVLCSGCHFWAHKNPLQFAEFVKEIKGKKTYNHLIKESNRLSTIYASYYQNIINSYQNK